jgi:hypothetical protein
MWVGDTPVKAELVEANKAREIYMSIVRQSQDPGLLEYLGSDLFQARIFPVPPNGDQKIAIAFTSVCARDKDTVEFVLSAENRRSGLANAGKIQFPCAD